MRHFRLVHAKRAQIFARKTRTKDIHYGHSDTKQAEGSVVGACSLIQIYLFFEARALFPIPRVCLIRCALGSTMTYLAPFSF